MRRAGALAAVLALTGALLFAAPAAAVETFDVTIRRTAHGIPHIKADSYASLGFGYGYSLAEDNICTIADSYVTVSAERSRFFGPDESWVFSGNGFRQNNLNSDFFFKRIIDTRIVEKLIAKPAPDGPLPGAKEAVRGYVAGYNHYLKTVGVDNISDPACRGADWVRPITEMDAYRRFYQLALLASGGIAINEIGSAQPPPPGAAVQPLSDAARQAMVNQLPERFNEALGIGSNAYGFGKKVTSNGRGMVLGNPHFPWQGAERLYQSHLTIPGKLDVAGSSLYGVPIVLIGHTKGLAWSHTVSTAFRFTPFELKLVPGSPTTYLYNGEPREMKRHELTVQARQGDGSLKDVTRTLYSSHHGVITTGIIGLPIFPWNHATAYAMGDANAANFRYINHFFEKNRAQSVDELFAVQKRNLGVPWVNTIAADRNGKAYYADISVVPHVTNAKAERCVNNPAWKAVFALLRLPILDGSTSECEWGVDPGSPQRGIFGPKNLPHLFRSDYVHNGNDSYWLTNPDKPLTGFARIIGNEDSARSLRTRSGLVMAEEAEKAGSFDVAGLKRLMFSNRQHAAELTRDEVVDMCRSFPGGMAPSTSGGLEDVSGACDVLEQWDLRDNLASRGALLFRRFWVHASGAAGGPWADRYDSQSPVTTPRDLNENHPQVREALGRAVSDLRRAGIPLDAPLGKFQYTKRGERIPLHGGPGGLGVFNAMNVTWNADEGYSSIPHGSSFIMAVQFTDSGCPAAWSLTSYSQSDNPKSRYYNDQTKLFSQKRWNRMRFCEADIAADPQLKTKRLVVRVADASGGPDPTAVGRADAGPTLPATGGASAGAGMFTLLLGGALARRRATRG
jgi:acyl-homoserine-lactone acylase